MHRRVLVVCVAAVLVSVLASCGGDTSTEPSGSSSAPTAEEARARMRDVLTQPGVSYLTADPSCPCAVVGVADDAAETRVRDFARAAGLPDSAVRIERQKPFKLAWNLRDGIRPIKGGLQIENEDRAKCTMFGTVFHRGRQAKGLLTNSHCTRTQFADDGIEFFQAGGALFSGDFVAREVLDPGSFTQSTDPGCPSGAVCRRSDAAFAQFDTSTVGIVGRVARTANPCLSAVCTLEMATNDPNSFLPVTGAGDGDVARGTRVSKVGRTTGWTVGPVTAVCADVSVGGLPAGATPIVMRCQTLVRAIADSGDSGSPVFTSQAGFTNAHYVGILWGSADGTGSDDDFVYSPLSGVEAELGAFDYH
jgi:hypothetical protein